MLILLSPAKTLDFDSPATTEKHTQPAFLTESRKLVKVLRDQSPADLARLMKISSPLADLNYQRYSDFRTPFTPANAKQAVLAFRGDVYTGLLADRWKDRDLAWAQEHLRILSGLYGLLRPLDLIQPYRLEMGTRLANARGDDLYAWWGERLTRALARELADQSRPVVVNLASKEYFSAVNPQGLGARVVTPTFRDLKDGEYRFISFYAKQARGLMASWIVQHRLRSVRKLEDFDVAGYRFNAELSDGDDLVFTRDEPAG